MDDNAAPQLWPFIYDRVFVHWKSTVMGLCSTALVIVPVFQAQGFTHQGLTLCGAIAMAISSALSKDN